MGKISDILKTAQQRAKEMNVPYEGALHPAEAYQIASEAPAAKIVDVRTKAELDWVGTIPGAVHIEWSSYPGNQINPNFSSQLRQQVDPESLVMFICRSGGRSHAAAVAATQAGYLDCYNILQGFEGDKDADGHRNTRGGWRAAGLPWKQT
jgi:rhodanese-related sulfurtransferase